MTRIRVFGPGKVHDEVVGDRRIITTPGTWDTFAMSIPRKGSCRHYIGHELVDDEKKGIPAKQLKDYAFADVCNRVERELAPKTG